MADARLRVSSHADKDGDLLYRFTANGRAVELWPASSDTYIVWTSSVPRPRWWDKLVPADGDEEISDRPLPLCTAQLLALEALGIATTVVEAAD